MYGVFGLGWVLLLLSTFLLNLFDLPMLLPFTKGQPQRATHLALRSESPLN
jgi:hypothetical protein